MHRRALLTSFGTLAVAPLTGCLSNGSSGAEMAKLHYVQVWNSNDLAQTFHVVLRNTAGEQTFERTVTVAGATGNRFTREKLSDAPASAATVRATVDDETAEKELRGYEGPVMISIEYYDNGKLGIADFV